MVKQCVNCAMGKGCVTDRPKTVLWCVDEMKSNIVSVPVPFMRPWESWQGKGWMGQGERMEWGALTWKLTQNRTGMIGVTLRFVNQTYCTLTGQWSICRLNKASSN